MIAEYLRKSRAEELMDSDDEVLAKHREYLANFAESKGIVVDDFYEEVVSGESIAARPQMQALLKGVRAGKYRAVLCMDIDRLGRGGMQDQGAILDAFRESETLIITPDKTYDLSNEQDEMLTEFKSFMSRQEYKIIRKRMQRGLMQTIAAGGYVANAPYGYRQCKKGKYPSLEIIPEEAEFVRYIYRRYQEGVGAVTISEELTAMGSVPHRNGRWSRSTVRVVLRNPTYKGVVPWNRVHRNKPGTEAYAKQKAVYLKEKDWILYPGLHEAIIPPDEWQRVQEIRIRKHIPSKKTGETTNPFAGLIVCSKCGTKMQRMGVSKNVPYLLCTTKGCCAAAKFEYVEEAVVSGLSDCLSEIEAKIKSAEPSNDDRFALAALNQELTKTEAAIRRVYDFLEDGTYDRATFKGRRAELDRKRSTIIKQQEAIREAMERHSIEKLKSSAEKIRVFLSLYPTLTPGQKNMLLKEIVEKIVYTKEKKTKQKDFDLKIVGFNF